MVFPTRTMCSVFTRGEIARGRCSNTIMHGLDALALPTFTMPPMPSFCASLKPITRVRKPLARPIFLACCDTQSGLQMLGGVAAILRASFTLAAMVTPRVNPAKNVLSEECTSSCKSFADFLVALPSKWSKRQAANAIPSAKLWPSASSAVARLSTCADGSTSMAVTFMRANTFTKRAPATRMLSSENFFLSPRPSANIFFPAATTSPLSARKPGCASAISIAPTCLEPRTALSPAKTQITVTGFVARRT